MNNLLQSPTVKDVKTYVCFAMAKPSFMNFDAAITLAGIQFNMNKSEVKACVYGSQELLEIVEAMRQPLIH